MWARCLDALKRGARPAPAAAVVAGPTPRQEDAQNLCEARPWELALRPAVLTVLGGASRLWMHVLNDTKVEGSEILAAAVQSRAPGRGLLTVSNHVCALDDPLVVAAAMPALSLLNCTELRWTLCATDRCFKGGMADSFFRAAKVLPVQRGAGLLQPGLLAAERRLAHGDWVHMVRRSLVRATALPWPGQRLSTPHSHSFQKARGLRMGTSARSSAAWDDSSARLLPLQRHSQGALCRWWFRLSILEWMRLTLGESCCARVKPFVC